MLKVRAELLWILPDAQAAEVSVQVLRKFANAFVVQAQVDHQLGSSLGSGEGLSVGLAHQVDATQIDGGRMQSTQGGPTPELSLHGLAIRRSVGGTGHGNPLD